MRIIIDTNIIIDYFGKRTPFIRAWNLISALQIIGEIELWAAPQSYADAFYVLRKDFDRYDLQKKFLKSLDFINICNVGINEVRSACENEWPDYEDSLISVCADLINADYILSRDVGDFRRAKCKAYTPDEFFKMLEEEQGLVYDFVD